MFHSQGDCCSHYVQQACFDMPVIANMHFASNDDHVVDDHVADITFWLAVMPSMPQMPNMNASLPWLRGDLNGPFEQDGLPDL